MFHRFNRWFPLVYLAENWRPLHWPKNRGEEIFVNTSLTRIETLIDQHSSLWCVLYSLIREILGGFWLFRRGRLLGFLLLSPFILILYHSPVYRRLANIDVLNPLHLAVFIIAVGLLVYFWHFVYRFGYQFISLKSDFLCLADCSLPLCQIFEIWKINKDIFIVYCRDGDKTLVYEVNHPALPYSEQRLWELIVNTYFFGRYRRV